MIDATPWLRDDQNRLAEDIPCRDCKYSLRGLLLEGACPECHAPVARSVHAELLRFADPRWLKRLAWGTGLLVVAIAATGPLKVVALSMVSIARGGAILVLACATTLQIGAVWLATMPERHALVKKRPISRPVARFSLLAGLLLAAALVQALAAGWWPKALEGWAPALVLADGVLFLAGIFAMGSWARSLALRMPDVKLAATTSVVTWLVVIAVPVQALATAVLDLTRAWSTWLDYTLFGAGIWGRITTMVCGVIALVLMFLYVRRLLAAARLAANRNPGLVTAR